MSDTPNPHSHFPRPSNPSVLITFAVIVCCFLAMGLVVYLAYLPNRSSSVSVDMSQVSEDMRWKYSVEGRKTRLEQVRANEADILNNYAWVDQSAGIVRVPVDRAMELIVNEQRDAKR